jgi:hypothetical protein
MHAAAPLVLTRTLLLLALPALAACAEQAPFARQLDVPAPPELPSGRPGSDAADEDAAADASASEVTAPPDSATSDAASPEDAAQGGSDAVGSTDVEGPDLTGDATGPRCGDGALDPGERCDLGIPQGAPGACPTACPAPSDRCATVRIDGEGCDRVCVEDPIATCEAGDSCCPAGCDALRDTDCAPVCGNGLVEPGERCDGACPARCDDADACTTDVASGSPERCDRVCTNTRISACASGDGCCPNGCNTNNDADCSPRCGNSVREAGETCDPPGSCPAMCNDGDACTADRLAGSAAGCNAACVFTPVTTCVGGDGCCPSGCDANSDRDCAPRCGNGVIEPGERCDGSCPTFCDDGLACTRDVLEGTGCTARCTTSAITACANGDGCCPSGCSLAQDSDCGARCGNNVREGTEACDGTATPANRTCTAGCALVPVATWRFRSLTLREPHASTRTIFGCSDITNQVNFQLSSSIQGDSNGNGVLDLSYFNLLEGLDLAVPSARRFGFVEAVCTAARPPVCSLSGAAPVWTGVSFNALSSVSAPTPCLEVIGDNIGYRSDIALPQPSGDGPCFASGEGAVILTVAGVDIPLTRARVAGVIQSGGRDIRTGLLRGFVTHEAAKATVFPSGVFLVGGRTLASLLPGGEGACGTIGGLSRVDGVEGWWFYLNYDATTNVLTDL